MSEVPFPSPLPDDIPPITITNPYAGLPDFRYTPPSGKQARRDRRKASRRTLKKKMKK